MPNVEVTVLEADGTTETDVEILGFGRQAAAASKSVARCTEDEAVLDAIAASLAVLDNVVAGSEAQVDIVGALPAGANEIGVVGLNAAALAALETITIASISAAIPAGNNNIGDVDVASLPTLDIASSALPTGAATSAKQDTIIGHVDGIETLLTAIDGHVDGLETTNSSIDTSNAAIKTSVELIDDAIVVDDAAFTPATTKVLMAGFQADEASTDSVNEGDAGAARMTLDRKQITTAQPHTSGGLAVFKSLDLDETEEDVKTSAGQLYGFYVVNRTTSPLFLRFYNATAANVTVGSTAHLAGPFEIPANASDHIGASVNFGGLGIEFDTAISAAATTGFADNDTGAPAANAMIINVFYK
jgi:hypothetical protein